MTRSRGFTLIETIFSTLFIGLSVLAIMNLFPGAYLSIGASERTLQADIVAESVMDELRSKWRFDTFSESGAMSDLEKPDGLELQKRLPKVAEDLFSSRRVVIDGTVYEFEVSFHKIPDFEPQSIVRVKVKVKYNVPTSFEPKEMVHETYLHTMGVRSSGFYTMSEGRSP